MNIDRLPSWRPGPTRDAVLAFLDAAPDVPVGDRLACFDNDGTLWCEKPSYIQLDFLVAALQAAVADDPSLAERPEFAATLSGDMARIGELGLERVALALAGLFEGLDPDEFGERAAAFMATAVHRRFERPLRSVVYRPMLELLAELRDLDFTISIVTGGGTEFVRAISDDLYGVPPELVIGTLIQYEFARDDAGRPALARTSGIDGAANEGPSKVCHIQTQLGRRPILAAGNSGGDREMLEWALAGEGPGLAILVDHDDADREFHYLSRAGTFEEAEPITDVGARLDWTIVSMANDWETIFDGDT